VLLVDTDIDTDIQIDMNTDIDIYFMKLMHVECTSVVQHSFVSKFVCFKIRLFSKCASVLEYLYLNVNIYE